MSATKRTKKEPPVQLSTNQIIENKMKSIVLRQQTIQSKVDAGAMLRDILLMKNVVEDNVARLIIEEFFEFGGDFKTPHQNRWTDAAILAFMEVLDGQTRVSDPFTKWFIATFDDIAFDNGIWGVDNVWDVFILTMRHFTVTPAIIAAGKDIVDALNADALVDDSSGATNWERLAMAFLDKLDPSGKIWE